MWLSALSLLSCQNGRVQPIEAEINRGIWSTISQPQFKDEKMQLNPILVMVGRFRTKNEVVELVVSWLVNYWQR